MTEAEAIARLATLAASGTFPTLTPDELEQALASARIVDPWGFDGLLETPWLPETAYEVGDTVVPSLRDGYIYVASQAGTSDSGEPTWDATGTTTDGTVEWEFFAEGWQPTHDLNMAAAMCWEMKAGKTSDRAAFAVDYKTFSPQQVFDHCMKMADMYRAKVMQSIRLVPLSAVGDDWAVNWRLPRA